MGQLPEGFCGTQQQLAQAIADRLIIQSDQNFSSFVIGPNAPTSNLGPWLKNCETWWVWDDASASYVEMDFPGLRARIMADIAGMNRFVMLSHQTNSGVAGPVLLAAQWNTRTLNVEDHDPAGICTLVANQITLPAGSYRVWAVSTSNGTADTRMRLSTVGGVTLCVGINSHFTNTFDGSTAMQGRFTIDAETTFELQHWSSAAPGAFGNACATGENEVWLQVIFIQE